MAKAKDKAVSLLSGLLRVGTAPKAQNYGVWKTGIAGLDVFFLDPHGQPLGGLMRGAHIVLAGAPKIGKSILCKHLMAAAQRAGLKTALVPSERDVTTAGTDHMEALGVDTKALVYIGDRDDGGMKYVMEETLATVSAAARAGLVDIVFIDSMAYLTPRAMAYKIESLGTKGEGKDLLEHKQAATRAQVLSQWMPGVGGDCADRGVSLMMVSQQRQNPGALPYQSADRVPDGFAYMHAASSVFWVKRRPAKELSAAEQEAGGSHWFFQLVLKESRSSPKVGEKIKLALPLYKPLWESELNQSATEGGDE